MRITQHGRDWFCATAITLLTAVPLAAQSAGRGGTATSGTQTPGASQAGGSPARAQGTEGTASLSKKLANPIGDLVSVPFQFNWEQNVGPAKQTRFVLNVQPVVPFALNGNWKLVARVIVPLVSQPPLFEGGTPAFGVGDVLTSFFFSPPEGTSGFAWGAGPVISLPSTTIATLGTEKWGAGPTIVAVQQTGPWTVGALWNQVWSFAGNQDRSDVSQMLVQPFLAYRAGSLTYTVQSESTANWKADDHKWTVPINLQVSKLSSFGMFPASYTIGFGLFAVHPPTGPSWKLRGAITILLPRQR